MVVGLRIESENIKSGVIKHCNSSYFTMVAKDDEGNGVPIPGLILDTEESVRRFARSITRQQHSKARSESFDAAEFKLEEHLETIAKHNAKVELS